MKREFESRMKGEETAYFGVRETQIEHLTDLVIWLAYYHVVQTMLWLHLPLKSCAIVDLSW